MIFWVIDGEVFLILIVNIAYLGQNNDSLFYKEFLNPKRDGW